MTENYTADSMDVVKNERTSIRQRPATMLGSSGKDGALHTIIEILGNVVDEASSGFGDKVEFTFHKEDNSISIRDFGRGVPMAWSEKNKRYGWDIVYNKLYAGGKLKDPKLRLIGFDDWDNFKFSDFPYLASVGLNGVGASCAQFTSEYFEVTSYRDGHKYFKRFEKGYPVGEELTVSDQGDEPNGTLVHWKPDSEVFSGLPLKFKDIEGMLKDLSYIAGLDLVINNGGKVTEIPRSSFSDHYLNLANGNATYDKYLYHEEDLDDTGNTLGVLVSEAQVVIGENSFKTSFFNNCIQVRGGVHQEYTYGAIYKLFKSLGSKEGYKFSDGDIYPHISVAVSTLANEKSYRGQTKDSIDNEYIGTAVYYAVENALIKAASSKASWLKRVYNNILDSYKLRLASKETEKQIKELNKQIKTSLPLKFKPCEFYIKKKYDLCELYILEGDSGAKGATGARNSDSQAIMPVKGKTLNTSRATINDILNNEEIMGLIRIIGTGVESTTEGFDAFNLSKLRFSKIIIMTDADSDGAHIRTLLLSFFYKYMPELVYRGYIYIAVVPKYDANGVFYYSDDEFEQAKADGLVGKHFKRFKGIGQMDAKDLKRSAMDPATRVLMRVEVDRDDHKFHKAIHDMSGKDSSRRKEIIMSKGREDGQEDEVSEEELEEIFNSLRENIEDSEIDYEEIFY